MSFYGVSIKSDFFVFFAPFRNFRVPTPFFIGDYPFDGPTLRNDNILVYNTEEAQLAYLFIDY